MPREPLTGLDQPCPHCGRVSGDHTLREWNDCVGRPTTDVPYGDVPADIAALAAENLRRSFGIPGDVIVADHVVVKALTLSGANGPIRICLPGLLHEFQVGILDRPPETVAKVLFTGNAEAVLGYGQLITQSAHGAVRAAERSAV